jgi:8-amino-7-oxononanoate synthase
MLDFTSALYLGLQHPHAELPPWDQLTTGRPAALQAPGDTRYVVTALATLMGCEQACLGPSTLHLFWDLFDLLAMQAITIHLDDGCYPIARWGVERVAARGVPVRPLRQHDVAMLQRQLEQSREPGRRPVVVVDGLCPATGRPAPLLAYATLMRQYGGLLVVDDTQALGILGQRPDLAQPYGYGGGGTPAWHGLQGPELIVVSSLAKALGAPVAVLAASAALINQFENHSATRMHCSPPSAAALAAARNALAINQSKGNALRHSLLQRVRQFRRGLRQNGLSAGGGLFPIQTPRLAVGAASCHTLLTLQGVSTVLHRPQERRPPRLSLLISAQHTSNDIATAIARLSLSARMADPSHSFMESPS